MSYFGIVIAGAYIQFSIANKKAALSSKGSPFLMIGENGSEQVHQTRNDCTTEP